MGTFYGKYIRNKFPTWTEINKSSSSNGGLLLDIFGKHMEDSIIDCHKNLNSIFIFSKKPNYFTNTFINDNFNNYIKYNLYVKDSVRYIKQISCYDNVNNESIPCFDLEFDGIKRFFNSYSVNLVIQNESKFEPRFILYKLAGGSSDNPLNKKDVISIPIYNKIKLKQAQRIYFNVKESNFLNKPNSFYKIETEMFITLRGYNQLNKKIEEQITIKHPGLYETKLLFDSICDIDNLPAIERSNFNGEIEILSYPVGPLKIEHDFLSIVKDKTIELDRVNEKFDSKLIVEFTNDHFIYQTRIIDDPLIYVNKFNNDVYRELFRQKLNLLLNENVLDIDYDVFNNKIIAITNIGDLLIFDIGAKEMQIPAMFPKTFEYDISFETDSERFPLNENINLKVFQGNIANKIENVLLIIQRPNGSISYIKNNNGNFFENNFLEFIKPKDHIEIEKIWQVINLPLSLNESGQWNFYSISFSSIFTNETIRSLIRSVNENVEESYDLFNKIRSYIDKYPQQKSILINTHSIVVENNTPIARYNITSPIESFSKLYIYQEGMANEFVVIRRKHDGVIEKKVISFEKNGILFDKSNGNILFHKMYEDVTFTIDLINGDSNIVRIQNA